MEALNLAGNVVASRTPKPSLLCVKLSAADDQLTISATDLEVAVRCVDQQVQIDEPGNALLPADKLRDIVRESVDDTLSLQVEGMGADIRGQDSHFHLFTQPVDDFPALPPFDGQADFEVAAGLLKQMIGQTVFAIAKESTRYAFNGILVSAKGKKLVLVGTDGRRLALAKGDLSAGSAAALQERDGLSAILPAKAMQLLEKILMDPQETVKVKISENQVIFQTAGVTLSSNRVEGQFPPYEDVLPKDADKKLTAGTADLLSATRRASLLTGEDSKGVRFALSASGLVISTRSAESGEATVNFPCKYEGADLEIGFNPQYLMEALRVADNDEVSLEMISANRPGLLRSGSNFLYVIMPVNLG